VAARLVGTVKNSSDRGSCGSCKHEPEHGGMNERTNERTNKRTNERILARRNARESHSRVSLNAPGAKRRPSKAIEDQDDGL